MRDEVTPGRGAWGRAAAKGISVDRGGGLGSAQGTTGSHRGPPTKPQGKRQALVLRNSPAGSAAGTRPRRWTPSFSADRTGLRWDPSGLVGGQWLTTPPRQPNSGDISPLEACETPCETPDGDAQR